MAERTTLINQRPINYKGLLDYKELYKVIDKWCKENGYVKVEHKNFEEVFEDGKQVILELVPYKKITDYAKIEIRIFMQITNAQERVVEIDGFKKNVWEANAFFSFDCYLVTDYEKSWETKPFYFFIRTLVDKFVIKEHTSKWKQQAVAECDKIIREIKDYLNMERFRK